MKKASSARRVPRKIGQDDDEPPTPASEGELVSGMSSSQSANINLYLTSCCSRWKPLTQGRAEITLKRPTVKPRKGSSLRTSFGPTAVEDEDSVPSGVMSPKRSTLSRLAIQRNASKQSKLSTSTIPTRQADDGEDRPSYSAAYLQELKDSTPVTPRDLSTDTSNSEVEDVSNGTQALDLSSKFGTSLSRYQQSSAIPSATEIAEKKARRARLAKEQAADEYISLDPSDPELDEDENDNVTRDEHGRLILKPKDKYNKTESRLVPEDEDIMENFDEFTEADSKILLGRKAEAEAIRQRKREMAAQIEEAEGADSDSDSNASERERNEAFEAAQTRHGAYALHNDSNDADADADARPRTPPKISPLPTLDGVIERLRRQVVDMQTERMQKLQEMEALQREKIRLGEEEVRIQRALKETGEKFAQLRAEKGITGPAAKEGTPALLDAPQSADLGAGLGARAGMGFGGDSGASTDVENVNGGRGGLGFGMSGRGLESLGTSAAVTPAGGDDGSDSSDDVDPNILAT